MRLANPLYPSLITTMIKITSSFAVIILVVLVFNGCSSDLPDDSMEGRNTFGMKVDGTKWENPAIGSPSATYYPIEKTLVIASRNRYNAERVILIANNVESTGNRHIDFVTSVSGAGDSTRLLIEDDFVNSYVLADSVSSVLKITKLDLSQKIVSGTFSMQLVNRDGHMLQITAGRFDIRLAIFD